MTSRVLAHVRAHLVSGLLLVLPLLITLWLLRILFRIIDENVTPWILLFAPLPARFVAALIGVLLTAGTIYLLGLLAGNLAGRKVWSLAEAGILRIPLVKGVYGGTRQLLDAFSISSKGGFSKVVLVEYPRAGVFTVGFVTSSRELRVGRGAPPAACVAVFLPTAPNPTSGWVVLVPREDLIVVDVTIEEGVKLVVSGGIVVPSGLERRLP